MVACVITSSLKVSHIHCMKELCLVSPVLHGWIYGHLANFDNAAVEQMFEILFSLFLVYSCEIVEYKSRSAGEVNSRFNFV